MYVDLRSALPLGEAKHRGARLRSFLSAGALGLWDTQLRGVGNET